MEKVKIKYFDCSCSSSDHVFRMGFDYDDKDAWLEVQLVQYENIFKRIWKAIKYILNKDCKYGHWDCTLMQRNEIKELRDELTSFLRKTK
jgi:hypothetical protein